MNINVLCTMADSGRHVTPTFCELRTMFPENLLTTYIHYSSVDCHCKNQCTLYTNELCVK